ncbi:spermidine/putrescine ABC transporter substrate-binding protein PotF [Oleiphilus sp. HI0009]|uniref:polyamine ABC transporter substrate-binding protein n=1 Tax=unclassified Oleiphilus TaxID=2631174 RepID=UPI0007C2A673|nr:MULTISPECIES: polyamine ABC transporter substrate-binding protein [unclassified Oleiphilus]KZX76165.1 spermidine/putrescine ABC transporter substrate-binding protein PotF [Oleiphilus sp. HI0009]KZY63219.1 spermidine/putrescine ABC transporter substrate-binding protein PotF [Oleiphilus sp. HI0066]KZY70590.1 spermidine/putrescine ABC transporter substrate-binding protein PotF [Oleiphilus sp. HI0067]
MIAKLHVLKTLTAASVLGIFASSAVAEKKDVFFYNWSDYIAENTIENFQKESGIKVVYDVFDSNDVLEAKLLAGRTGYDIVVPSGDFMARQIQAGIYQKLDLSKIPNAKGLDPQAMKIISSLDPNNEHAIPYMWGTTGIGINVNMVKERLGEDFPLDSWNLILDPEVSSKLADCGITILDAWDEFVPSVLNYLGEDSQNQNAKLLKSVAEPALKKIRPNIRYFHSSLYINDLANGDVCVSVGWSGDILQAMDRASEAENGVEIAYIIPKEGAPIWFDLMLIPKDAPNVDNAHALINYLIDPKVMADITNYVWYPNAIPASKEFIDPEIVEDESIYPPQAVLDKLFPAPINGPRYDRAGSRMWSAFKAAK